MDIIKKINIISDSTIQKENKFVVFSNVKNLYLFEPTQNDIPNVVYLSHYFVCQEVISRLSGSLMKIGGEKISGVFNNFFDALFAGCEINKILSEIKIPQESNPEGKIIDSRISIHYGRFFTIAFEWATRLSEIDNIKKQSTNNSLHETNMVEIMGYNFLLSHKISEIASGGQVLITKPALERYLDFSKIKSDNDIFITIKPKIYEFKKIPDNQNILRREMNTELSRSESFFIPDTYQVITHIKARELIKYSSRKEHNKPMTSLNSQHAILDVSKMTKGDKL